MKILSKLLSSGILASELAVWVWLYGYISDVGIGGAISGFLFHTFWLYAVFALLMILKRYAEKHAWPKWSVKTLRVLFSVGYVYDCWYSSRFGTLVFLELSPVRVIHVMGLKIRHRFEPLTSRLKRHYKMQGWRGNIARLYCWLIHKVDKGHCL